jgi:hypothetical protein
MNVILLNDGKDGLNPAQREKQMIKEYHAKKTFTAIISFGIIVVALLVIVALCFACATGVLYILSFLIK